MFKEYIRNAPVYKGGSTRDEVNGTQKVYKLSSNENMLGPSPKAIQAISDNLYRLHEYQYQDDNKFRNALALSFGYSINEEQFITANSGLELLDIICRGFLSPRDEAILSTPTFLAYASFIKVNGGKVIDVPLKSNDFSLNIPAILKAVNQKTKLIFISSPNNPCGSVVTTNEMYKLVDALPDHVVVVYDEVYHHYVEHPGFARAIHYIKEERPVIGLHSFSKAYGLAGMRLGYAFSTPEISAYLRQLRRPFMINTLSAEAGIAALSDYEHIEKTTELVEKEKAFLYKELQKLNVRYWPGHANFILIQPPYEGKKFAADMLQSGIMVRTTEVFGLADHIRLTVGTREANTAFINLLKLLK